MLIVASLLPWLGSPARAAQPPTGATPTNPAPPTQPPPLPPLTVSPVIQRFMRQSGRDLPPPAPPPIPLTSPGHWQGPSSRPGTTAPSAVNRPASVDDHDVLSPLPSRAAPGRAQERSDAAALPPSPLELTVKLDPAPFVPTDLRFPINLATALRLSDARPLIVAAAQASVWVAEADLQQAKVLWLPGINVGADYLRHDGGGPDFNKGIMTAVSANYFYGGGGLWGAIATTDAIYQPLVARQALKARHWDVQSAKNDALLRTADAYFLVHQYRGKYAGALYCVKRGHELVERLASMSRDLVVEFEVERAKNMVADLQQRAVSARQQWRVQAPT